MILWPRGKREKNFQVFILKKNLIFKICIQLQNSHYIIGFIIFRCKMYDI